MKDESAGLFVPEWSFQCDTCGKSKVRNVIMVLGSENQAVKFLRNNGWQVGKSGRCTCGECRAEHKGE